MKTNKKKIKQKIYYNARDELAPGDEDYWWMVSTIASWIGSALTGQSNGNRHSTIWVSQVKEKFGAICVYCHFVDQSLVVEKYKERQTIINSANERYQKWLAEKPVSKSGARAGKHRYLEDLFNSDVYPKVIPPLGEFEKERELEDAVFYRGVYLDAIRMWPEYESVILGRADFSYLLIKTEKELDERFEKQLSDPKLSAFIASYKKDYEFAKKVMKLDKKRRGI